LFVKTESSFYPMKIHND